MPRATPVSVVSSEPSAAARAVRDRTTSATRVTWCRECRDWSTALPDCSACRWTAPSTTPGSRPVVLSRGVVFRMAWLQTTAMCGGVAWPRAAAGCACLGASVHAWIVALAVSPGLRAMPTCNRYRFS